MNEVIIGLSSKSQMYEQFSYPAGEWQVRLKPEIEAMIDHATTVRIIARLTSAEDIVKLALLRDAVGPKGREKGVTVDLVLPYLPYSRADRRFTDGDCAGIEVFGCLIGTMDFDAVFTLDAHNHGAAALAIPNLIDRSPSHFIERAVVDFARRTGRERNHITVLFPDEGARARYALPSRYQGNVSHVDLDIVHCSKRRDVITGTLLGFDMPALPDQPVIIIDDICDGGGTFLGIAKEFAGKEAALYISHGIFSKGLTVLSSLFGHIYTTNTFAEHESSEFLTVYDVLPILRENC